MSRDVGVDQDVLEAFGLRQAQWPHPVARPPDGDDQGQLDEVGIEVTDLVARPEGDRIAGARPDGQTGGQLRVPRRARRRLTTAEGFDLEETGIGNQPADDAPLERRREPGERDAVAREVGRQLGDRVIEKSVFLAEDVSGARQQLARRGIKRIDRRENLLPEAIASKSGVIVARIAAWDQVESRQVCLDVLS
jgi:hypothetical protein